MKSNESYKEFRKQFIENSSIYTAPVEVIEKIIEYLYEQRNNK